MILLQLSDKFLLHIVINVAIAGEGYGTVSVTGQRAYEVGVFDAAVQIATESLARYIFDGIADNVAFCHTYQIADTTSDAAVKDENIPLYG